VTALDAEGRRLLWRCRRGLKELDVLLERYAAAALAEAGSAERHVLERLLALPDPELAGYLLAGQIPEEAELAALAGRIRHAGGAGRAACGMIGPRDRTGPTEGEDV
jgi:antitoxin CptB